MYSKIPELRFLIWHRFILNVTSEFRLDNKSGIQVTIMVRFRL